MTYGDTQRQWSRRPSWELRNMVQALNLIPWLNTKEDIERRTVAEDILRDRGRAKIGLPKVRRCRDCGTSKSPELLSGIETCPPCTGVWVKSYTDLHSKADYELDDPTSVFSEFGPS